MDEQPSTPKPRVVETGQPEEGLKTPEARVGGQEGGSPSTPVSGMGASTTTTNRPPPNLVSKPTISTPMSTTGHAGVTGSPGVTLSPAGKGAATVGLGAGGAGTGSSPLKQAKKNNPTKARKLGDLTVGGTTAQTQAQVQAQAQAQAQADEKDPTRQGKGKDLSHVPCRFYKMGVCAAGDGCVFSHSGVDSEFCFGG